MEKTLTVQDATRRAQDLAWLVQYLQAPDVRHARFVVMSKLARKQYRRWSLKEKEEAATACAAYGVAGIYVKTHRVNQEPVIDNWGPSIVWLGKICREFIDDRRLKSGPTYWSALDWLIEEANRASPA